MKPLIGITASFDDTYIINDQNYANSLEKAGAIPVILPPLHDLSRVDAVLARLDGLILSGGQDISPFRYDQDPHPNCASYSDLRDAYEIALYNKARQLELPILAICRGMQLVNVIHGGTLVQDIVSQRPDSLEHAKPDVTATAHRITIESGSVMEQIMGGSAVVNSLHHQAIDQPGEGLKVTARAGDDMIEALEADNLIAVQFHPERLFSQPAFLRFFEELVRRAK